ncbi:hypothetical protein CALCODRAFT_178584 [Calocera cornea HHB12733]|uniref:F-box domain-containing protein n=1 Tax=Calocera cornea HHB12733 TaxID=1353952 RepID=A0A165CE09_9BASI|nr:hypothetical protein CALCODRAFT_178584 [Calocera cornea HHB12733]
MDFFPIYTDLPITPVEDLDDPTKACREIWERIIDNIDDPRDLVRLGLTSRFVYALVREPLRRRWVTVQSGDDYFWYDCRPKDVHRLHLWLDEPLGPSDGFTNPAMPWNARMTFWSELGSVTKEIFPYLVNLSHLTISCPWDRLHIFRPLFIKLPPRLVSLELRISAPRVHRPGYVSRSPEYYQPDPRLDKDALRLIALAARRLTRFSYKAYYHVAPRLELARALVDSLLPAKSLAHFALDFGEPLPGLPQELFGLPIWERVKWHALTSLTILGLDFTSPAHLRSFQMFIARHEFISSLTVPGWFVGCFHPAVLPWVESVTYVGPACVRGIARILELETQFTRPLKSLAFSPEMNADQQQAIAHLEAQHTKRGIRQDLYDMGWFESPIEADLEVVRQHFGYNPLDDFEGALRRFLNAARRKTTIEHLNLSPDGRQYDEWFIRYLMQIGQGLPCIRKLGIAISPDSILRDWVSRFD